ncbi:hypothetical protein DL770_011446 [Monosporascus sp. CRB-9-2]|nr:hypothetical protein DL770_011446 [Monosporascus sp. CRB-9-2]
MGTVEHTLVVGIALVLAVLFVFLGNFRAAAVVAAVIPLALCVSFISMEHFHVPANLISLGAIDFGVIVDAAVIVMENIMRHLEEGAEKLEDAIVKATNEVQRAMIFSTASSSWRIRRCSSSAAWKASSSSRWRSRWALR